MASYVTAYRIGMLASGAGVIGLSAWLESKGLSKEAVWPLTYAGAAVLVLVGLAATLLAREPASAEDDAANVRAGPLERFSETAKGAFLEFINRDAALSIMAFVVLFKLCDTLASAMTAPFVLALGIQRARLCWRRNVFLQTNCG